MTWTNIPASGPTNREFRVDAWFDLNTNGTQEAWETHRQLFVTVAKGEVTNIKFNWDTNSSASDAINIRQDYATSYDISNGEWLKGGANIPACYTTNRAVTIKARLTIQPTNITQAAVWAISTDTGGSLGDVAKTNVTFVNGVSSPEYVTFQVSGATPNCIQKTTNDVWQWKMENVAGSGCPGLDLNTSGVHTVYTILSEPSPPWSNDIDLNTNTWVTALNWSCNWASGTTNLTDAAAMVTKGIHDAAPFRYDKVSGGWGFKNPAEDEWNATVFIQKLTNPGTQEGCCYDGAQAVCVFVNILGGNFRFLYSEPFGYLNVIDPIGRGLDLCNSPFTENASYRSDPFCYQDGTTVSCGRSPFGNHAFAGPAGGGSATVWDATMKVISGTSNPDTCAVYPPDAKVPATSSALSATVLTDTNANWTADQYMSVGTNKYYLFPTVNATTPVPYRRYEITGNTTTSITVLAGSNMTGDGASVGDCYEMFNFDQGNEQPVGVSMNYMTNMFWPTYRTNAVDNVPATTTGNPTSYVPFSIK